MIGIYKIISPTNKVYVGQSVDIERRFNSYKKLQCKGQPKLENSFKKYGVENHKFLILVECSIENLNSVEREMQEKYNVNSKNGLNCILTKTEDISGILSDETKQKMSEAKKGKIFSAEHKLKLSEAWKKRIVSDETKNKMSVANKGKKLSKETRLKMSEIKKGKIFSNETKLKMAESQKGNQNAKKSKYKC